MSPDFSVQRVRQQRTFAAAHRQPPTLEETIVPNHFSTIGFDIKNQQEFIAVARATAPDAQAVFVQHGRYLRWTGRDGEELWLQVGENGHFLGMHPHFSGSAVMRVRLTSRVECGGTALDGTFMAWALPDVSHDEEGAYPFVFDSPDSDTKGDLQFPSMAEIQLAAFAHQISFHESPEAYERSQTDAKVKFASRSFVPAGLFTLEDSQPPSALALLTGHVIEAETRTNEKTGARFYWALVDSLGGLHDVVIDSSLLAAAPTPGGVISGEFWLSGRILSSARS